MAGARAARPALVYGATHKTRFLTRPNCLQSPMPPFRSAAPSLHPWELFEVGRRLGKPNKWQSRPSKMDVLRHEPTGQPPIPSGYATSVGLLLRILNWLSIRRGAPVDRWRPERATGPPTCPVFAIKGATLIYHDLPLPHPCAAALLCFAVPLGRHASQRTDGAIYTAEFGVHHLIPGESLSVL